MVMVDASMAAACVMMEQLAFIQMRMTQGVVWSWLTVSVQSICVSKEQEVCTKIKPEKRYIVVMASVPAACVMTKHTSCR